MVVPAEQQRTSDRTAKDELCLLRRLTEQYAKEEERRKKHLSNLTEALKERVCNGETTGDSIADYFLSEFGIIDEEIAKPLFELEEKMKGKEGQLFLVVQTASERTLYGHDAHSSCLVLKKKYFLGILSSPNLVFGEAAQLFAGETKLGVYGIPAESYRTIELLDRNGPEVVKGPFLFPFGRGVHKSEPITIGAQSAPEFEVIIGDTEVLKYRPPTDVFFKVWVTALNKAARELKKGLPES